MSEYLPPVIAQLTGEIDDLLAKLAEASGALEDFASKDYTANLNLSIDRVLAEAEEAQEAIDSITGNDVSVDANISALLEEVALAQAALDSLADPDTGIHEIPLEVNPDEAIAAISIVKKDIEGIDTLMPWLDIQTVKANAKIAILQSQIAAAMADNTLDVAVNDIDALAKVGLLQAAFQELSDPIVIDFNIGGAEAKLAILDAQIAAMKAELTLSMAGGALASAAGGGGSGAGSGGGSFWGTLLGDAFGGGAKGQLGFGQSLLPSIPVAGHSSLGALAGLGPEALLGLVTGVGGSAINAGLGGAALGATSAGVMGVGMATDAAGIGQAAGDIKNYNQLLTNLNQAIAVYGQGSIQAALAQYQMNQFLQDLTPAAQSAIEAANSTSTAFHAMFDQATGDAEAKGANIIASLEKTAEAFLPTIGQFASQNMSIIQQSLQPLQQWLVGPGLQAFTVLEQTFQDHLPTAMDAFNNTVELVLRTMAHFAPQTGGLITWFDNLVDKLNGPGFSKFMGEIQNAIGSFHTWEDLIKAVGDAIDVIWRNDAGTGAAFVKTLTSLVNEFNKWANTVAGGDKLHDYLEAHKKEVLELEQLFGHLIGTFGELHLTAGPALMNIVSGILDLVNALSKVPGIGWILSYGFALETMGSHIRLLGSLLGVFHSALQSLATAGINALGSAISGLGGPFSRLGGWMQSIGNTNPSAQMVAASEAMQAAADTMSEAAASMAASMQSVGAEATGMAAKVTAATEVIDADAIGAETALAGVDAAAGAEGAAAGLAEGEAAAESFGGTLSGMIGPIGIFAAAVAGVTYGADKLGNAISSWTGGNTIGALASQLNGLVQAADGLQTGSIDAMAVSLDTLNRSVNASNGQSNTVAQNMAALKALGSTGMGAAATSAEALYQKYVLLTTGAKETAKNVSDLSKQFGVNQSTAESLAGSLGIDLTKSLDPTDIKSFKDALKQQDDQATATGKSVGNMGTAVKQAGDLAKPAQANYGGLAQIFNQLATAATQAPQVATNMGIVDGALASLADGAPQLKATLKDVDDAFKGMAKSGTITAVGNMFQSIGNLFTNFGNAVTGAVGVTQSGVDQLMAALQLLVSNATPIEQAILSIIDQFKSLGNLKQAGSSISSVAGIIGQLTSVFTNFGTMISGAAAITVPAISAVQASLQWIINGAPTIVLQIQAIQKAFAGLSGAGSALTSVSGIISQLTTIFSSFGTMISGAAAISVPSVNAMQQSLQAIVNGAPTIVNQVIAIQSAFGKLGDTDALSAQLGSLSSLFSSLAGIFTNVASASQSAGGVTQTSVDQIVTALGQITTALSGVSGAITTNVSAILTSFQNMGTSISQYFTGTLVPAMKLIGMDLMSGLAQGIQSGADVAIGAAQAIAGRIEDIVRQALGTRSPSTVFHSIGLDIMKGLANGIAAGTSGVLATLTTVAHSMQSPFSSMSLSASGATGAGVGSASTEGVAMWQLMEAEQLLTNQLMSAANGSAAQAAAQSDLTNVQQQIASTISSSYAAISDPQGAQAQAVASLTQQETQLEAAMADATGNTKLLASLQQQLTVVQQNLLAAQTQLSAQSQAALASAPADEQSAIAAFAAAGGINLTPQNVAAITQQIAAQNAASAAAYAAYLANAPQAGNGASAAAAIANLTAIARAEGITQAAQPAPVNAGHGGNGAQVIQVTTPIQVNGQQLASTVTTYQVRSARSTGSVHSRYAGSSQTGAATRFNTNAIQR